MDAQSNAYKYAVSSILKRLRYNRKFEWAIVANSSDRVFRQCLRVATVVALSLL